MNRSNYLYEDYYNMFDEAKKLELQNILNDMKIASKYQSKDEVRNQIEIKYRDFIVDMNTGLSEVPIGYNNDPFSYLFDELYRISKVDCLNDAQCYEPSTCVDNKCTFKSDYTIKKPCDETNCPFGTCVNGVCVSYVPKIRQIQKKEALMNFLYMRNKDLIDTGLPNFGVDGSCTNMDLMYHKKTIIKGHMQSGKTQFMISLAFRYFLCNKSVIIMLRNSTNDLVQIRDRLKQGELPQFRKIADFGSDLDDSIIITSNDNDYKNKLFARTDEEGNFKPQIIITLANPSQLNTLLSNISEYDMTDKFVFIVDEADQFLPQTVKQVPQPIINFAQNVEYVLQTSGIPVRTTRADVNRINQYNRNNPTAPMPVPAISPNSEFLNAFKVYMQNILNNRYTSNADIESIMVLDDDELRVLFFQNHPVFNTFNLFTGDIPNVINELLAVRTGELLNSVSNKAYSTFIVSATMMDNLLVDRREERDIVLNVTNFNDIERYDTRFKLIEPPNIIILDPLPEYRGIPTLQYQNIPLNCQCGINCLNRRFCAIDINNPVQCSTNGGPGYCLHVVQQAAILPTTRNYRLTDPLRYQQDNWNHINENTGLGDYFKRFDSFRGDNIIVPILGNPFMPNICLVKVSKTHKPNTIIYNYLISNYIGSIIPIYWMGDEVLPGEINLGIKMTIQKDNLNYLTVKGTTVVGTNTIETIIFQVGKEEIESKYNVSQNEFQFNSEVGISNVLTILQDSMTRPKGGRPIWFQNICIITGAYADRGISFSSKIRPGVWHIRDMYYIPSDDTSDAELLQASGRLCGNFGNDGVILTLYCTPTVQEDIITAYAYQEEFIRRYKTRNTMNVLSWLSNPSIVKPDFSNQPLEMITPRPQYRSKNRRDIFKYKPFPIREDIKILNENNVRNYVGDPLENDFNTIRNFLSNLPLNTWVDTNTIVLNSKLIYPIEISNYNDISSTITGYNNLQIAIDTDNTVYYKLNDYIQRPPTLIFPSPVVTVVPPVRTGGPERRSTRTIRTPTFP